VNIGSLRKGAGFQAVEARMRIRSRATTASANNSGVQVRNIVWSASSITFYESGG